MTRQIVDAVRTGSKARVALAGPAGSGKTWTALVLAQELAPEGKFLVIDTERGSASLYADQFRFQTISWEPPYDPRELAKVVAGASGDFDVVVIDSLSHFWSGEGGTLGLVDDAGARAKGNKFAGWKEGTPAQDSMVSAMLNARCHVIATMRSKMEYVLDQVGGRTQPRKVGMAPIQRDGMEYEFTVTCDIEIDHRVMVTKTRCHLVADKVYAPHRASELGATLRDWLGEAAPTPPIPRAAPPAAEDPGRHFDPPEAPKTSPDTGQSAYAKAVHIAASEADVDADALADIIYAITGDRSANSVNRENRAAVMDGIKAAAQ